MKKIKITVSYPWNVPDDWIILEIDDFDKKSINDIAFDTALDMIFDRGIGWDWKEIK